MRRRLVVAGVSVLASVLLGVASGAVLVLGSGAGREGPTESERDVPVAELPTETVRRYLQALAEEDASAALAEAAVLPADRTLLTDEVLRASHQAAPISEVSVPESTSASSYVEASYRIGQEVVTRSFRVTEVGGGFALDGVVSTLDVQGLRSEELPLVVAGVEVNSDSVTLFPGLYPVRTRSPHVGYGPGQVLVKYPGDSPATGALRPVLTEQARTTSADLVREQLRDCLTSTAAEPAGCPFAADVSSSHQVVEGSGAWSSEDADLLADFDPALDSEDATSATWALSTTLDYAYRYTSDLEDGTQEETTQVYVSTTYRIDLSAEELAISFS